LLWCADAAAFRPVWQSEIEVETHRNGVRLRVKQGDDAKGATAALDRTLALMNAAFPDARLDSQLWVPLVPAMTNHLKDRHILAAAVRAGASHVVTFNMKDFPVCSRPAGVTVLRPDVFPMYLLATNKAGIVEAVVKMAAQRSRPAQTPTELAEWIANGICAPRFGKALATVLAS